MLQAGAIVAEHLRLVRQLGSGGMGSVWVAEQTRLGGHVAVKFLSTALLDHESARSRFDREARLVAKIKSQHVVQVHDHGVTTTEPAIPYIVMELLEGTDLSKLLDRSGPVGLAKAAEIIDQICDALTKAHDAGIVHRDIKPENVIVLDEARTFIKLLDFGVAHGKDTGIDRLTQTGLLLGTAHYMSPEQLFSGKDIDARADLWALGILSYQMLANEVPFQAETFGQLCLQVRDGTFPALSTKVNVPPGVDVWFEKALSTDRAHRFQSATEMARAFRRAIAGEDPLGEEPGTTTLAGQTGTGTVRVDKSEITRIREEARRQLSSDPTSVDGAPPATQRFGSQPGSEAAATPHDVSRNEFVVRGTLSTGEQPAASGAVSGVQEVAPRSNDGPIAGNTPLADLSGSFGTEAKGVLALEPRATDAGGRTFKWLGWLLAAAALGGAGVYLFGRSLDHTAAAGTAQEVSRHSTATTPAIDVVRAGGHDAVPGGVTADAPLGAASQTSNTTQNAPLENADSLGNRASTVAENAVTGEAVAATAGSSQPPRASVLSAIPTSSGAATQVPVSSGQRGPKSSGPSTPAKSNDHASSDKPSIPQAAVDQQPTPKHEPSVNKSEPSPKPDPVKPKYRGF